MIAFVLALAMQQIQVPPPSDPDPEVYRGMDCSLYSDGYGLSSVCSLHGMPLMMVYRGGTQAYLPMSHVELNRSWEPLNPVVEIDKHRYTLAKALLWQAMTISLAIVDVPASKGTYGFQVLGENRQTMFFVLDGSVECYRTAGHEFSMVCDKKGQR